jgi:hypothetical protein
LIVILLSPLPLLCFLHLLHPLLLFLSPSQKVFLIGFFAFFFVITLDVVDLFLIVLDRIVFPFFIVAEVVIGSTGVQGSPIAAMLGALRFGALSEKIGRRYSILFALMCYRELEFHRAFSPRPRFCWSTRLKT